MGMVERLVEAFVADLGRVAPLSGSTIRYDRETGCVDIDGCFRPVEVVRRLLEAMREPTEAMMRAGYDGANMDIGGDWIGTVEVQTTIGKTAWHYMIDAALSHPTGEGK